MFIVSFANFNSRALSCDPPGDRMMPRAEVCVRAQASYGHFAVLSLATLIERDEMAS